MNILKNSEKFVKSLIYKFFRFFFDNKPASIPFEIKKIRRILFFRYDRIGDMIITLPLFHLIKREFPEIELDVIATHKNKQFVKYDDSIKNIYVKKEGLFSFIKLVTKLRKYEYDAVFCLDFTKTTNAGILANLVGGKNSLKAIQGNSHRRVLYSALFNFMPERERNSLRMADMLLSIFNSTFGLNLEFYNNDKRIIIPRKIYSEAKEYLKMNNISGFVFYNLSAGSEFRKLSLEKNLNIIRYIYTLGFPNILLHYTPEDENLAMNLLLTDERLILMMPVKDMLFVSAVIEDSIFVFTPDTSVVHIAAAFNKPGLSLYSNHNCSVKEWLPLCDRIDYIIADEDKSIESIEDTYIFEKLRLKFEEINENRI